MKTGPYQITFAKRAAVPLADNEKVSAWEDGRGSITRLEDAITLKGTWRVSAAANVVGGGLLGALLIRPFFMKDREETIPLQHLERVVVRKKWTGKVFHLFQNRDGGMVEVHAFTAYKEEDIEQFLKSLLPESRILAAS